MRKKRDRILKLSFAVLVVMAASTVIAGVSDAQQAVKPKAASKTSANTGHAGPPVAGTASDALNPFDRYLANAKARRNEPALERFASTCGVNVSKVKPEYAERNGERWKVVKALTRLPNSPKVDSYYTLEVWQAGPRVVTEEWGIQSGDYYRVFACLQGKRITSAESMSWNVPDAKDSAGESGWGYQVRWELKGGKFVRASTRFLDLHEEPISEPKLDEDAKKDLEDQDYDMRTWADLEYPAALLKWDGD